MKTVVLILAFCLIFSGVASAAEKLKEPTVEYSALMTMQAEGTTVKTKVYHALGGKERHEPQVEKGQSQAMIMRMDRKLSWLLMPEQKMYMEMALSDAQKKGGADVKDCSFDMKEAGTETVNGVRATKSEVRMSCPGEGKGDGALWITKEGIMVRMDATMTDKDGRKTRVKLDLTNLKIGKQDPALFEIPKGYTKMDMGKMFQGGGMPGAGVEKQSQPEVKEESAPMEEGERAPSVEKEEEPATSEPAQESTTDKLKKLKGIFKW